MDVNAVKNALVEPRQEFQSSAAFGEQIRTINVESECGCYLHSQSQCKCKMADNEGFGPLVNDGVEALKLVCDLREHSDLTSNKAANIFRYIVCRGAVTSPHGFTCLLASSLSFRHALGLILLLALALCLFLLLLHV